MQSLGYILNLLGNNPWSITILFFKYGGTFLLLIVFFHLLYKHHKEQEISQKKKQEVSYILLAIDIPRINAQSLMAVESIFIALSSLKDHQVSFEIISLEGYIQFLVRCQTTARDLIEAAIFAQYPDAEIAEVRDYTSDIPADIHEVDSVYNMWCTDFVFEKESFVPIKIVSQISDKFDPMASMLENLSKIRQGEMIALQMVVTPESSKWNEDGKKYLGKLKNKEEVKGAPDHVGDKTINWILEKLWNFSEWILSFGLNWASEPAKKEEKPKVEEDPYTQQMIKAVADKISHYGFKTKIRLLYIAHKQVFSKERGVVAVMGVLNQFNSLGLNSIVPSKTAVTQVDGYFKIPEKLSAKQAEMIGLYKSRSMGGDKPMVMIGQELASIYHFPAVNMKASLVKTVEAAKSSAPVSLPIGDIDFEIPVAGTVINDPITQAMMNTSSLPEQPKMAIMDSPNLANKQYEDFYNVNQAPHGLPLHSPHDIVDSVVQTSSEGNEGKVSSSDTYDPNDMFNLGNKNSN